MIYYPFFKYKDVLYKYRKAIRKTKNYDDLVNTMCLASNPRCLPAVRQGNRFHKATQQTKDYAGMVKWWCDLRFLFILTFLIIILEMNPAIFFSNMALFSHTSSSGATYK
jgi:hypothetical protein